jgi:nucleoside-diphosphate kinase
MTSDIVVGLELTKKDAIKAWRTVMGPTNVDQAIKEAPDSVRAKFGTAGDLTRNATHGSDSPKSAARELDFFFGLKSPLKACPITRKSTLCIVKPHVVAKD